MDMTIKKLLATNECTPMRPVSIAMQCQVHWVKGVQGFTRCHWTPRPGKYLHCIAPADTGAAY
jgi:hypothetical protein